MKDLAGEYFLGAISSSVAPPLKTVAPEKIQKDNWGIISDNAGHTSSAFLNRHSGNSIHLKNILRISGLGIFQLLMAFSGSNFILSTLITRFFPLKRG